MKHHVICKRHDGLKLCYFESPSILIRSLSLTCGKVSDSWILFYSESCSKGWSLFTIDCSNLDFIFQSLSVSIHDVRDLNTFRAIISRKEVYDPFILGTNDLFVKVFCIEYLQVFGYLLLGPLILIIPSIRWGSDTIHQGFNLFIGHRYDRTYSFFFRVSC
jgi:hypothetical protein